MSNNSENVDRSAIDKENLDYFKTLIRHLQRIPDNKILLFRQEVDALLLKYAHHYVHKDSVPTVTRESRRRKYSSSSESESEAETLTLPAAKADKRKSKVVQTHIGAQKRPRQSQQVNLSDDDDILVVKEVKAPVTSNTSSIKEEPTGERWKNPVKKERSVATPVQRHQEAPTSSPSHSNTPDYQQNHNYAPQPNMTSDRYNTTSQVPGHQQQINNASYYGHPDYTNSHRRDLPPGFPSTSTQHAHCNPSHPSQQPLNNREMLPGLHQPPPPPQYANPGSFHPSQQAQNRDTQPGLHQPPPPQHSNPGSFNPYQQPQGNGETQPGLHQPPPPQHDNPSSLHPSQLPHNNRQMQPGFHQPAPPQYGNQGSFHSSQQLQNNVETQPGLYPPPSSQYANSSHPPQIQSDMNSSHNRQVMYQTSGYQSNQQYGTSADSTQVTNGLNTYPPQDGYVHRAPSTSANSIASTPETQESSHDQSRPPTTNSGQTGSVEQSEIIKQNDKSDKI